MLLSNARFCPESKARNPWAGVDRRPITKWKDSVPRLLLGPELRIRNSRSSASIMKPRYFSARLLQAEINEMPPPPPLLQRPLLCLIEVEVLLEQHNTIKAACFVVDHHHHPWLLTAAPKTKHWEAGPPADRPGCTLHFLAANLEGSRDNPRSRLP